ncbi:hypothetical protein D3C85_1832550 [compost metagenome]
MELNIVAQLKGIALPIRGLRPALSQPWLEGAVRQFGHQAVKNITEYPVRYGEAALARVQRIR